MRREILEGQAEELVREGDSRDPEELAAFAGVTVRYKELGSLKGLYICIGDDRFIVVNASLDNSMRRVVCAHELGHDCFHRHLAQDRALHEFAQSTGGDRTEYEANVFAAALLIDDEELMENASLSFEGLARLFGVDMDLLAIKLHCMRERGYDCPTLSYRSDFLRR